MLAHGGACGRGDLRQGEECRGREWEDEAKDRRREGLRRSSTHGVECGLSDVPKSPACLRGFSIPSFSLFPDAYTRKNLAETPKTAASFVANSGVMGLTPCSMSETRT